MAFSRMNHTYLVPYDLYMNVHTVSYRLLQIMYSYIVHVYVVYVRGNRKDKKVSSKSANAEMTEAASIQGSPTEVTYAETAKAFNGGTHTGPAVHYDYARTGAVKVRFNSSPGIV